jgi:hypothetical protein
VHRKTSGESVASAWGRRRAPVGGGGQKGQGMFSRGEFIA